MEKKSGLGLEEKVSSSHFLDSYFRPREFEKRGKLYEYLGVRYFHKLYLATYGRIIKSLAGEDRWIKNLSRDELENQEKWTRLYEEVHFMGNLIIMPLIINNLADGNYQRAIKGAVINTVFNLYPIMMQRYNRARIQKVLKRLEKRKNSI